VILVFFGAAAFGAKKGAADSRPGIRGQKRWGKGGKRNRFCAARQKTSKSTRGLINKITEPKGIERKGRKGKTSQGRNSNVRGTLWQKRIEKQKKKGERSFKKSKPTAEAGN